MAGLCGTYILQGVGLAQEVWVRGKQVCDWFVWDIHTTRGGPSTGSVGEGKTGLLLVCVGHTTRSGPSTVSVGERKTVL